MSFKSKAEIRKWMGFVKDGTLPQSQFDAKMKATENVHALPERLNPQQPKTPKMKTVGTAKVIK